MSRQQEDKLVTLLTLIYGKSRSGRSVPETVALVDTPSALAREVASLLREEPSPDVSAAAVIMLEFLADHCELTEKAYAITRQAFEHLAGRKSGL